MIAEMQNVYTRMRTKFGYSHRDARMAAVLRATRVFNVNRHNARKIFDAAYSA